MLLLVLLGICCHHLHSEKSIIIRYVWKKKVHSHRSIFFFLRVNKSKKFIFNIEKQFYIFQLQLFYERKNKISRSSTPFYFLTNVLIDFI